MDSWTNNEKDLSFVKVEDTSPVFVFLFVVFFCQLNLPDKKSAFSSCSCTVCQLITLCVLSKRLRAVRTVFCSYVGTNLALTLEMTANHLGSFDGGDGWRGKVGSLQGV